MSSLVSLTWRLGLVLWMFLCFLAELWVHSLVCGSVVVVKIICCYWNSLSRSPSASRRLLLLAEAHRRLPGSLRRPWTSGFLLHGLSCSWWWKPAACVSVKIWNVFMVVSPPPPWSCHPFSVSRTFKIQARTNMFPKSLSYIISNKWGGCGSGGREGCTLTRRFNPSNWRLCWQFNERCVIIKVLLIE